MSLAEASEARKARLAALRRKKAGESIGEEKYVLFHVFPHAKNLHVFSMLHHVADQYSFTLST